MIPGEIFPASGEIVLNKDKQPSLLKSQTQATGRFRSAVIIISPRQRSPGFRSKVALGYRLNIPAGTAVRFEPGQSRGSLVNSIRRRAPGLWIQQGCHGRLAEQHSAFWRISVQ